MDRIYTDDDADPASLTGTIAILGYGSQGRAHARNLRDGGHDVVVGARPGGGAERRAIEDGFKPEPPAEAAAKASLLALLTPDMTHKPVYATAIAPNLRPGSTLLVRARLFVHTARSRRAANMDVVLVAPKGPGDLVRREYVAAAACRACTPCTRTRRAGAQGACARLCPRASAGRAGGCIETTFAEETETDLFGEQSVLCGGVTELVVAGYETLVDGGLSARGRLFRVPA